MRTALETDVVQEAGAQDANTIVQGVFTQYGAAALSTDTGHLSGTEDGTWALNAPERIVDWAWRAMHESVVLSKHLITSYYARDIEHSYYAACSTGGRQGLKEIEEFPADFDGIVVGAAAWWFTNLPAATVQLGKVNLPETADYHIPSNLWQPIVDEMIRQCDPQDGVTDGIVSDPYRCNFYAENLLCTPGKDPSACLQPAQMDTLHKIYSDYVDTNQTLVYPALTLGSSAFLLGGGENGAPLGVGLSWIQNAVYNDSNWPWQDFDFSTVQLLQLKDPGNSTADNFDLSAFRARGGKVIMYHGLADFLIPTGSSLTFYQKVTQTLAPRGIDLDDFFKFYLIPGMGHCSGADTAAWYVGAAYQTGISGLTHGVPGYEDSKHDILLALQDWVENGDAPEEIIGTKFKNEDVSQGVERQRPLCPYPKQAKYCGTGDLDQPDNWSCEYLY